MYFDPGLSNDFGGSPFLVVDRICRFDMRCLVETLQAYTGPVYGGRRILWKFRHGVRR